MTPRRAFTVAALAALTFGLTAPNALAAPPSAEQGARLHTNTELARTLDGIERAGHGAVDVRSIGRTNERRPIWLATVGRGPIRLMYVTQQHGDEPLGTESAIHALRTLGLGQGAWARWLRAKVTLAVIVRANPDGHERNWRYNYDPDANPTYGERGKGYDINRYHNPGLAPEDNPVPEAAAIQRAYATFSPSIFVDYHMQGRYRLPNGQEITTSLRWPTNPTTAPAVVTRSKQVAVSVHDAFTRAGAVVSQYPGGEYEGIARNAYGLRGSASVLVELSALPPERENFQIRTAYASMIALAHDAASGRLDTLDPARADAIPPRGPEIPGGSANARDAA